MEFEDSVCLTIFTGEDVLLDDKPLYKAIMEKARELELAGVTVTVGKSGFARTRRGMKPAMSHFFSGVANLPMVIEIVDKKENIEKILPFLEKHAVHCSVVLNPCQVLVTDYLKQKFSCEK